MARRCAASLSIPVIGTLDIVLAAKKNNFIAKARPVIEDITKAGLYLSDKVIDTVLQKVGE